MADVTGDGIDDYTFFTLHWVVNLYHEADPERGLPAERGAIRLRWLNPDGADVSISVGRGAASDDGPCGTRDDCFDELGNPLPDNGDFGVVVAGASPPTLQDAVIDFCSDAFRIKRQRHKGTKGFVYSSYSATGTKCGDADGDGIADPDGTIDFMVETRLK